MLTGENGSALPEYDESAPSPWLHIEDVPRPTVDPNAGLIRATNQEWHATWAATEWQRQQAVARVAELEETLEAWVKRAMAWNDRIAELLTENAALKQAPAALINPTPADLPPPARRPDGTLTPEPKPLPVLKQAGDTRRVGG